MIKLYIFIIISLATTMRTKAQEATILKIGLGAGVSFSDGNSDSDGGGLFYTIEPGVSVTKNLDINFRFEDAATQIDGELFSTDIESYTLNGQYYFSEGDFRPYVSTGFGLYKSESYYSGSNIKFGLYPGVGFNYGFFTLNLNYNIIPNTERPVNATDNYFSIRIGGFFTIRSRPSPPKGS